MGEMLMSGGSDGLVRVIEVRPLIDEVVRNCLYWRLDEARTALNRNRQRKSEGVNAAGIVNEELESTWYGPNQSIQSSSLRCRYSRRKEKSVVGVGVGVGGER